MDLGELRERIRQGENVHTDLQERVGGPRELSKDLVCFANTDGGQLIIGVRDDGVLVGVDDPERVSRMVDNVAFNNCEPPLTVVQEVFEEAGKKIVVVNIIPRMIRLVRQATGKDIDITIRSFETLLTIPRKNDELTDRR